MEAVFITTYIVGVVWFSAALIFMNPKKKRKS